MISFSMLIYFINHVAVSLQAPVVVARVKDELLYAIDRDFPKILETASVLSAPKNATSKMPSDLTDSPYTVMAEASSYIQFRDDKSLLQFAHEHNIVIQLLSQPGDFIVKDTPLAKVWSNKPFTNEWDAAINEAFILGQQRTLVQDVTFGINELVEVAIRALSPAINDPFTAMTCLDWLGTALCQICKRVLPSATVYDEEGQLRLIRIPVTFTSLTDAAFNQIREYGRNSTAVTLRLMDTIIVIAQCARTEEQRVALQHHATLVERGSLLGLPEKVDQELIASRYQVITSMLGKATLQV
jgi:uncharacterized membrane protein